jgi:hypothetical protein
MYVCGVGYVIYEYKKKKKKKKRIKFYELYTFVGDSLID